MRITFTGVQCTGKTTLMNILQDIDKFNNYTFIKESIRGLKDKGYKINEDGDDDTQLAIMTAHIMNLLPENSFIDRCSLDALCYGEYSYKHNKICKSTFDYCKKVFDITKNEYDIIFYLVPEFEMIEDGTRSCNKEFRDEVANIFEKYIKECNNVFKITGNVEERINQILTIIGEVECKEK